MPAFLSVPSSGGLFLRVTWLSSTDVLLWSEVLLRLKKLRNLNRGRDDLGAVPGEVKDDAPEDESVAAAVVTGIFSILGWPLFAHQVAAPEAPSSR